MYTVQYLYDRILSGIDKEGSDLITLEDVMRRVKDATYDFIGETVKYIENTQEIRDDIRTLYKPFRWPLIELPEVADVVDPPPARYGYSLPDDYQHLMSAMVEDENVTVRDTRIIRHGQLEIYQSNPNKKPAAEYPLLVLYSNYIEVFSPGSPKDLVGFYLVKPTIWTYNENANLDTVIAVNLPDHSVEKIIRDVINDIFISTGDPRAQGQFQTKEQYRKRGGI